MFEWMLECDNLWESWSLIQMFASKILFQCLFSVTSKMKVFWQSVLDQPTEQRPLALGKSAFTGWSLAEIKMASIF